MTHLEETIRKNADSWTMYSGKKQLRIWVEDLPKLISELSACQCTVEQTTDHTEVRCCNICGLPLKSESWK